MLAQLLVDSLIHPVARLLVALCLEIAVFFHKGEVAVDHIPYFGYTELVIA